MQVADVLLTQAVFVHASPPMLAAGLRFSMPKLVPEMVVVTPEVDGPFAINARVTTGESYVNPYAEADRADICMFAVKPVPEPCGIPHLTALCEIQSTEVQEELANFTVTDVSEEPKFIPTRVIVADAEGGPFGGDKPEITGASYVKTLSTVPVTAPTSRVAAALMVEPALAVQ
jgi:hypothetical protein